MSNNLSSYATHITITNGGDWMEISSQTGNRLMKNSLESKSHTERREMSFAYIAKDGARRLAQAAAIKFSNGSIWDNTMETWRSY